VRSRPEEPRLQVLSKAVIDGQRYDQRSHARRYPQDGDARDDSNECLAAFGAKVSGCDEEFEAH
jgi:hypothetical protein